MQPSVLAVARQPAEPRLEPAERAGHGHALRGGPCLSREALREIAVEDAFAGPGLTTRHGAKDLGEEQHDSRRQHATQHAQERGIPAPFALCDPQAMDPTRLSLSILLDRPGAGERPAYHCRRGLRTVTWSRARLRAAAVHLARGLEARGVGRGDRVLLRAGNTPEWVAAFFGCVLRGAVVVPLEARSRPELALRIQRRVDAKLLVAEQGLDGGPPLLPIAELEAVDERDTDPALSPFEAGPDDLVEIIFTSGTTAEPKGVCISHGNVLANLTAVEDEARRVLPWVRPLGPLRLASPLPLSHLFGQFLGMFVPLMLGIEVVLLDSAKPSEVMEAIRQGGVWVLAGVPRQLEMLAEAVRREAAAGPGGEAFERDLAAADSWTFWKRLWRFRRVHRRFGWRFVLLVSGGAALPPETESFWRRLGFVVAQGYGLTEATSLVSANHPLRVDPGTIGKALHGQELKVGPGGEILVRGENVSPGYWEGGIVPMTDPDGWLHTGDVGELGPEGALRFRERAKDVIVTAAGTNVYPADLEAALARRPEVARCAVVGLDGPRGPEAVAVLVLGEPHADPVEAVRRANEELASHQQIRRFCVWPEPDFPRTAATGKVRKAEVAEAVKALLAGRPPARDQWSPLSEAIAAVGGEVPERLDPGADLTTALKLDSLGRVELLSALEERYQVELDEGAFTAATTLGDVQRMLGGGEAARADPYPYPEWALRFPGTWLRRLLLYGLVLPVTGLLAWPRVRASERLAGLQGPALVISNHVTMFDQAFVLAALPIRLRHRLVIAMDGELLREWRHPRERRLPGRLWWPAVYAFTVAAFNVFPLPKKAGFRRSLAWAGRALDRGYSVLVFPEGVRTEDGRMGRFMPGIGLFARDLGVPVVPLRIDGLFELKQARRPFARPGRVQVTFGEPVRFAPGDDPEAFTRELERRMSALSPGKSSTP